MQLFNRFRLKIRRRLATAFGRIADRIRRRHQFFEPLEARHMLAGDWQNPSLAADINASNGVVTALDALIVINELNSPQISSNGGMLPSLSQNVGPPPYLDPTGDGFVTATDALFVINYLSTQSAANNDSSPTPAASALPTTSSTPTSASSAAPFFNHSNELLLNTPSPYLQQTPTIAVTAGGSVVVWSSVAQDGSDWGVYGQRLDQQGQKVGPEFRINQTTFKSQWSPSIDALPDGRFVVTWEGVDQPGDPGWGVYARIFNADATPAGDEFRVNETTAGTQHTPTVAALTDGTFAITWAGKGVVNKKLKEDYEVFVRRFSSTGTPLSAQTRVNANTKGAQEHPVIAAAPAGGFAITWNGYGASDSTGVYMRRFSAAGTAIGSETLVNSSFKKGDQRQATLDFAADGRILVTWASTDHQNGWGVYAQRFNANGTRLGNEILVNQYLSGTQWHPSIASLPDSTFIVSWEGKSAADPYGISYRQFSAAGVAIGGEQLLNQTTIGTQRNAVLGVGQTSFMVAWDGYGNGDYDGIYSRGAATSGPPINQPPVTTIPAAQSLNEDSVFAFSAATSNRITIADSDAGTDPIEVTLAVSHGKLTLTNRTGLAFSFNDGQDDMAMKFTGTVADINAALNTLFYAPTPDYNGPDGLNIMTSDLGHTGVGGVGTDNDTISLNVLAVNDAPSFAKGADQNADSSAGAQTVATWATNLSAGPADESAQTLTFQVTAANPALFSTPPAISSTGTLTYTPAANATGSTTVTVRLKDSGGTARNGVDTSAPQTFTINLTNGGQIDGSAFTLREGSAFNTDVNRSFTVPAAASILQVFFDAPSFDTQSQGTVRDAFEAALVDANGQTLVHTIANSRDAFFNQTEGLSAASGVNTQFSSGLIQLDLSHIPAGTQATLVVRLVNNDTDTNTSVRISNLKIITGSLNTPVGVASAAALPTATIPAADFPRLTNISSDITPSFGATSLHEDNTVLFTDVSLKNTGNTTLRGPLVAVVDSLSDPSIAVQNPDGFTPAGLPYFNFQSSIPGGTLTPGESTTSRTLSFLNPTGIQFTFHVSVYSLPNTEPTVTDIPNLEALVGQPFRYQVEASDPENDGLSYKLLAGPPNMTISPTGQINWTPTTNDTGTQQVIVRISDGAGGTVDETFTIVVRNNVPNRPPIITSSPVTDAAVAVSFDITDYTVGRGPVGLAIGNFTGNGQSIVTANEINQSISLADYIAAGSSSTARTTILGEPPPRTDQLFEQGYNVDVGMVLNRSQDIRGLTSADFNDDGIADIATAIHGGGFFQEDNAVTVMLGLGDGTYAVPRVVYRNITQSDNNSVLSVLARDFDGDGKIDLIAGENGAKNVIFFKGQGDGTFGGPVRSATIYSPQYLRAADFNNDNKLDLFVVGTGANGWLPEVLLANGDGTFAASTQYASGASGYIADAQLGDMDGINGPDLIIGNWESGRVEIRLNDGTGHFANLKTSDSHPKSGVAAITVGDFNEDGKLDLNIGHLFGANSTNFGNGDGTITVATEPSPYIIEAGFQQNRAYADGGNSALDLNGDGHLDVFYASRGNNILLVGLGRGDGTFNYDYMFSQPASDDPTRRPEGAGFSNPIALDANDDGVLDIATGSFNLGGAGERAGRLSIILGDTPGSFRTPYFYPQTLSTNVFADLSNDGAPDILGVGPPLASALNNADGTFADYVRALGGQGNEFYLNYAAVTDFDNDGNQDVLWAGTAGQQGGPGPRLLLSRGLGNGLFAPPTIFGAGTGGLQVGAADLTGDGKAEPVNVTTGGAGKVIQIWKNNGTATGFTVIPDANHLLEYATTGSSLAGFALADFDGDGVTDLVAHQAPGSQDSPPEKFMFFKGHVKENPADVSELFDAPLVTTPGLTDIRKMIAADLNKDGKLDLVLKAQFNTFTMLGNGNGTFGPKQTINVGVEDVTVGDFNGDGIPDLGTSNSFLAPGFLLGNGDGTFGRVQYYAPSSGANYMVDSADIDGDGRADFLLSSGNDAGSFRASNVYLSRRPGIQSAATGDINGDGKLDALAVDYGLGHLTPLLGDGKGNVTRQNDIIVDRGPVAATMLDLTSDSKDDIISVNRAGNSISVLINNGTGTFIRTDLATGQRPVAIATANFTSDQIPDLVVANSDETTVSIFKSTGSGQFAAGIRLPIGIHPSQVALGDLNGDGRADIIATSETDRAYVIALNDGNGGFSVQTAIPTAASTAGLAVGDLNGDGRADLVITNPDEHRVSLYLGLGAGKFATPQPIHFDHTPTAVKLADMNGDGRLDIVTSNTDTDTATVIISRFNPASTYRYQVTAADPDGDTVSFTLQTAPSGMSIDSATGQITWSATPDQIGPHNVVVQAADGKGGLATQKYVVTVSAGDNNAPRFVTTPVSTNLSTTDYHYAARAADGDKDPVRYEIASGPDGLTIDPNTGDLSWGNSTGRGVQFNGKEDILVVGSTPSLQFTDELTYSTWVKFDKTPVENGRQAFLAGSTTEQRTVALVARDVNRAAKFTFNYMGREAISSTIIQDDVWYHVTATYKFDQSIRLYINGVLESEAPVNGFSRPPETFLTFGNNPGDGYRESGLAGSLDSVRAFNKELTAQQAVDEFHRAGPNAPGLVGDWQFNEQEGPLALDSSGNQNHGTLGAPYAGRRMRATFDDRVTPAGRSGDYPVVIRATDGRGGASEQAFTLHITADSAATLVGRVFNDLNNDQQSTGEPGLAGWMVYLDLDNNGAKSPTEPTATSDASGYYSFTNVVPGVYTVAINGQPGFRTTVPASGSTTVNLSAGQSAFVDQFASSVIAFSNQRSGVAYSASQALGAPNAPRYALEDRAWAPGPQNGTQEFITLGYALPVRAYGVTIRESLGSGFVTKIELLDTSDVFHTIWTGTDPTSAFRGTPTDFNVTFAPTEYLVKGVKVTITTDSDLTDEEQIDSVQLRGIDPAKLTNFGEIAAATGTRGPAFISSAVTTGQVNEPYFYQTKVRNLDGRPLTFDVLVAPDGLAMNAQTGGLFWQPTTAQSGPNRILIRVKDDRGLVDIQDFTINVAAAPSAPIFSSTPLTTAALGVAYKYQPRVQDAEGGSFTFALTEFPAGMTINTQTGLLSWTPASGQENTAHQVTITATDSTGLTGSQEFEITVAATATNHNPDITSSPRKTAGLARPYRYQLTGTDEDGDTITYSLVNPPAGMTIDSDNIIHWTPDQLGDYLVNILATDGRNGSDSQSFTASVTSQLFNSLPIFTTAPPAAVAAGTLFAYDAHATDADGDAVQYILDKAPAGMSLDPETGTLRWQTTESLRGDFAVTIRALDPYGAEATQSFTLAVRSASAPPAITSIPPTTASANFSYTYAVIATDPFTRPLTYSLLTFPLGMTINAATGVITWTPTSTQLGPQSIEVQVANTAGGSATQTFSIVVNDGTANLPPVITSTAPENATVNATYQYDIAATDPEGQLASYTLKSGPLGVSIDTQTGRLTWTPTAAQIGSHQITVAATDLAGATALQTFLVTVLPVNNAPTINSTAPNKPISGGATFRYTVAATDQDSDVLTYTLTQSPAGMTIDTFGRITWLTPPRTTQQGQLNFPVTVNVADGRGGSVNQQFTLNIVPDTTKPKVAVVPTSNLVYTPASAIIRVAATDDVAIASLKLTMDGQPVPLDDHGVAVIPFPATGRISTFVATAVDASGNTATASTSVRFFNANEDSNFPNVSIASPADSGVVFGPTDVIGTVADDNLREWHLSYRREDGTDDDFIEIASGTATINNGVLGKFDPTLLENDAYILRLTAVDNTGFETFTDTRVGVSGELKLGNFQLAFTDLVIPVSGIPITVTRTYDTLRSNKQGDFGYGWRLDFRNTDLRTGLPKTGLEDFGIYSAFRPGTKVYLTLPGGKREGYTFNPEIRSFLDLTTVTPRFTPDPGVTNTLTVKGGTFLLGEDGGIYSGGGQPYNPAAEEFGGGYTLRTKAGIVYQIDGNTGLLKEVGDRNGNQLQFNDAGIQSDTGTNITFQRDSSGRIVSIVDPRGNTLRYAYDSRGDLTTVTNRTGNQTKYVYRTTPAHYLDEVIDPLGNTGARLNYNADGRLVGTSSELGSTVTFSYDPANSLVRTTNALGQPTIVEYDARGNLVAETDALGRKVTFVYDDNNRRIERTDASGEVIRYSYDASGNELSRLDPLGHQYSFTYGAFGILTSTTDPLGNTTHYELDERGNRLSETDPLGRSTLYAYDDRGLLTQRTDAAGNLSEYEYNAAGFQTRVVYADGASTTLAYDATGNATGATTVVTTPTGPRTLTISSQYDANGQLTKFIDAEGHPTLVTHNPNGLQQSVTDALGRQTQYQYDDNGRNTAIVRPDGSIIDQDVNELGQVTATTKPGSIKLQNVYDAAGQATGIVLPDQTPANPNDNPRANATYDVNGRLAGVVDVNGSAQSFTYDAFGKVTSKTDAASGTTTSEYDAANRLVRQTDALGRATTFAYDAAGQLVSAVLANGAVQTFAYDLRGNRVAITDALNRTTKYEYDTRNRLTAVIDPAGGRTEYAYNEIGNVVRQQDANGHVTRYEYDGRGLQTAIIRPMGQREQFIFDAAGQVSEQINAVGERVRYKYDLLGRVTETRFDDGSITAYTYAANGALDTITDERGVTRVVSDAQGRVTSRTEPDGRKIEYTYDAAGNILSAKTPAGTTSYVYDTAGRLQTVTDLDGGVTTYAYDEAGNVISLARPDGTRELRDYDSLNAISRVLTLTNQGTTLSDLTYQYDASGRLTEFEHVGIAETTYAYDVNNHLLSEVRVATGGVTETIHYTYDAVGNRLRMTPGTGTATQYEYNANGELTRSTTGSAVTTFTYDAAGRLATKSSGGETTTNHWSKMSQLSGVDIVSPSGNHVLRYTYDASGNRVASTVDGVTARYLLDYNRPFVDVAEIYTTAGQSLRGYTFGYERLSEHVADVPAYLHADRLGSTIYITGAAGSISGTVDYDAFGNVRTATGTGQTQEFLFTGEQRDAHTGLQYLRARYYDPSVGRLTSVDPFLGNQLDPHSQHRYLYANASPTNFTDPSGQTTLAEQIVSISLYSSIVGISAGAMALAVNKFTGSDEWNGITALFSVDVGSVGVAGAGVFLGGSVLSSTNDRGTSTVAVNALFGVTLGVNVLAGSSGPAADYLRQGTAGAVAGNLALAPNILSLGASYLASLLPFDIAVGSSTIYTPKAFSGEAPSPVPLIGPFLSAGAGVSGGIGFAPQFTALASALGSPWLSTSLGVSVVVQGFLGIGYSLPDTGFVLKPSLGASFYTGVSAPLYWETYYATPSAPSRG